jgi:hypothetical protein
MAPSHRPHRLPPLVVPDTKPPPVAPATAPAASIPAAAAPAHPSQGAVAAGLDEDRYVRTIQALERGRQIRKRGLAEVALQMKAVKAAAVKMHRLAPLEGHLLEGGFPGMPVNPSMIFALSQTPEDASCYEHTRDAVLRFFVRRQRAFMRAACLLAVAFVIDSECRPQAYKRRRPTASAHMWPTCNPTLSSRANPLARALPLPSLWHAHSSSATPMCRTTPCAAQPRMRCDFTPPFPQFLSSPLSSGAPSLAWA